MTKMMRLTHLDAKDLSVTRQLKKKLRQNVRIFSLTVFGSRTRGDSSPDSDLDVFIGVLVLTPVIRAAISETTWRSAWIQV